MKNKKDRREYYKEYRKMNIDRICDYKQKKYKDTHITVEEKRECYATGDYEKALEELMKRKGIKEIRIL